MKRLPSVRSLCSSPALLSAACLRNEQLGGGIWRCGTWCRIPSLEPSGWEPFLIEKATSHKQAPTSEDLPNMDLELDLQVNSVSTHYTNGLSQSPEMELPFRLWHFKSGPECSDSGPHGDLQAFSTSLTLSIPHPLNRYSTSFCSRK